MSPGARERRRRAHHLPHCAIIGPRHRHHRDARGRVAPAPPRPQPGRRRAAPRRPAGPRTAATRSPMSTPLSWPPTTQTTRGYARQRRERRVRVGRLAVVDVGHPVRPWPRARCGAARGRSRPARRGWPRPARRAPGQRGRGQRVGDVVRRRPGGSRAAAMICASPSGRSTSTPSTTPEPAGPRARRGVNPTVRPAHPGQQLGHQRIVEIAHRHPGRVAPRQIAGLRPRVRVEVPCHSRWSSARFSSAPACGRQRRRPVQLEAGQLHGEHVEAGPAPAASTSGSPMLPSAAVRSPAARRIAREHRHRGGLAVGAGDAPATAARPARAAARPAPARE